MAEAVTVAIRTKRHLAVQAGTGTGKTLAYLVPAILSGQRTIVATATKALQDQLAGKDLPFLDEHLGVPFDWAVLKGRSNYLCRQRLVEHTAKDGAGQQLGLDGVAERAPAEELRTLAAWALTSPTGDRAELDAEPSEQAWAAVSVGARECPARAGARAGSPASPRRPVSAPWPPTSWSSTCTSTALTSRRAAVILPEHDLVIIDEAHQLEDIVSATSGVELTAARFTDLARGSAA